MSLASAYDQQEVSWALTGKPILIVLALNKHITSGRDKLFHQRLCGSLLMVEVPCLVAVSRRVVAWLVGLESTA